MNSKGNDYADAIIKEVADNWPGMTVEFVEGGKHPKAKFTFGGKTMSRPFSGTSGIAIKTMLGDMRRVMRQLGAERAKPESAAEDEAAYSKPNPGKALRPDPVARVPATPKPTVREQLDSAVKIRREPAGEMEPPEPDPNTLEGREILARADGWLEDGEHDIEAERYHLDPCETPSLSSSIAKIAIEKSMLHAWTAHPRLNPAFEVQDRLILRVGRAFSTMMLGKGGDVEVFDYPDWRKNDAKEERDDCLARGCTPLLAHQYEELELMVRAAKRQISQREELAYALSGGVPERVFIWTEETPAGPVRCRMMADWTPHAGRYAVDWKTTSAGAGPNDWGQKVMWETGCDIQDAFYRRGWKAVLKRDYDAIIFPVIETKPPFAMMTHRVMFEDQEKAERRVQWAINAWAMCLKHKRWPGYPTDMAWQSAPGWRAKRNEAREEQGMLDPAMLEMQIQNLESMRDINPRLEGAETTESNPFGLDPVGDEHGD